MASTPEIFSRGGQRAAIQAGKERAPGLPTNPRKAASSIRYWSGCAKRALAEAARRGAR